MKKEEYIIVLNVISCIAVVFLHTNGCFWTFSTELYWKTANIIECLCYFCVPCFFMITGATLLEYREKYSLKQYFQKRVFKTVIPFIVWSIVGILYRYYALNNLEISIDNKKGIVDIYNSIVDTSIINIYWFFISLFCIYLSIPLFAAVEKAARKEVFSYLAIVGFLINFIVPLIKNAFFQSVSWPISIPVVSGSLVFVVIGYLLHKYELNGRWRKGIYTVAFVGFLIHLLGVYFTSVEAGEVMRTFKGFSSAPSIMYSTGIYVWIKYNYQKLMSNKFIRKIIYSIYPYTLGIYLLQWFVYTTVISIFDIDITSILYRLGGPFIVIPISIIVVWIIKKIPIVKCIVP